MFPSLLCYYGVAAKLDSNTFNSNLSAACKSQVKTEDIISADVDFSPGNWCDQYNIRWLFGGSFVYVYHTLKMKEADLIVDVLNMCIFLILKLFFNISEYTCGQSSVLR